MVRLSNIVSPSFTPYYQRVLLTLCLAEKSLTQLFSGAVNSRLVNTILNKLRDITFLASLAVLGISVFVLVWLMTFSALNIYDVHVREFWDQFVIFLGFGGLSALILILIIGLLPEVRDGWFCQVSGSWSLNSIDRRQKHEPLS